MQRCSDKKPNRDRMVGSSIPFRFRYSFICQGTSTRRQL